MSKFDAKNNAAPGTKSLPDKRRHDATPLTFRQLDPSCIVHGVRTNEGYLARDFFLAGEIRETCPVCGKTHLKLVLLQVGVTKAHLVCTACTRCFEALYPDGTSALETPCFYSFD